MLLCRFSLVLVLIYHSLNALITTEHCATGPGYFFHSRLSHSACTKCYVDQLWYRTVFGWKTVFLREIEDVLGLYAKMILTHMTYKQSLFLPSLPEIFTFLSLCHLLRLWNPPLFHLYPIFAIVVSACLTGRCVYWSVFCLISCCTVLFCQHFLISVTLPVAI